MEPAIRIPRIEPAIITDRAQQGPFWPQKALNLPDLPNGIGPLQSYCGERNFWMQRREAEIGLRDRKSDRRPKEQEDTGENSHRKGLFWVGLEIWGLVGLDGGRTSLAKLVSNANSLLTGKYREFLRN
jgi:hypothetical protein